MSLGRHFLAAFVAALLATATVTAEPVKVLIVDGQNNHGMWPKTTMMMKSFLEETGRFTVDIGRTAFIWQGEEYLDEYALEDKQRYQVVPRPRTDPDFCPEFSRYDVVVSNYNGAPWPAETEQEFEEFVSAGGGFVVVHAADNAFSHWPQYNEMIGLGGWGGRNLKSGPYVFYRGDQLVRDATTPGPGGSHGPQHEFQVVIRDRDHPITRGMPPAWLHAKDELYDSLRGPATNMHVLATSISRKTGRHEPMMMTIQYGEGRVFHTPLGHADYSMQCVGFMTTLIRGTEWAATGQVTQGIPADFPKPTQSVSREWPPADQR